jgi:uncharacterized membrane protein YfcA
MIVFLILLGTGLAAGTLGGLLGLGGGIILMPLLRFGFGLPPMYAAGTCILAVFFTTLGGSFRHYRMGNVRVRPLLPVVAAGIISVVAASLVFPHLATRDRWVDLGIGAVFSLIAMRMLTEGITGRRAGVSDKAPAGAVAGPVAARLGIGAAAGVLPGMLGIGTGGILVPAFTLLLRTPIKLAIGASLFCFCLNSLISSAFKISQGYVDFSLALPVSLGTLAGAGIGAALNGRFSSRALKLLFGLVFAYVALKFVLSFFGVRI